MSNHDCCNPYGQSAYHRPRNFHVSTLSTINFALSNATLAPGSYIPVTEEWPGKNEQLAKIRGLLDQADLHGAPPGHLSTVARACVSQVAL